MVGKEYLALSKEDPYLLEEKHSVNGEGDSYTHVHVGLNTGRGSVPGLGVFTAD